MTPENNSKKWTPKEEQKLRKLLETNLENDTLYDGPARVGVKSASAQS